MKWAAFFATLVVVLVLGLTAIDKYDERTCVQAAGQTAAQSRSIYASRIARGSGCDGFLPW